MSSLSRRRHGLGYRVYLSDVHEYVQRKHSSQGFEQMLILQCAKDLISPEAQGVAVTDRLTSTLPMLAHMSQCHSRSSSQSVLPCYLKACAEHLMSRLRLLTYRS